MRVYRLSESNFRPPTSLGSRDLFDLGEFTLRGTKPDLDVVAAEVLLAEGVVLDQTWTRRDLNGVRAIVADGVAVVLDLDITDAVVEEALALKPRVVSFVEDGFAGKDAVKANAFTQARNLGITMKTV